MLFIQRWGRLHMPPWLIRNIPEWHVTSTLKKAMPIIEHRRGCRFVELEGKLRPLESRPLQLVSGRRDSYIPVEVTKAVLAETGHDETSLWEVPGAKHNGARNVHPDEFDERIVTLFSESAAGREYDQA